MQSMLPHNNTYRLQVQIKWPMQYINTGTAIAWHPDHVSLYKQWVVNHSMNHFFLSFSYIKYKAIAHFLENRAPRYFNIYTIRLHNHFCEKVTLKMSARSLPVFISTTPGRYVPGLLTLYHLYYLMLMHSIFIITQAIFSFVAISKFMQHQVKNEHMKTIMIYRNI